MKTSNKLILTLLGLSLASTLVGMMIIKSHLVVIEPGSQDHHHEGLKGNGVVSTKMISDSVNSTILFVEDYQTWYLDPNSTGIKAEWDENLLGLIEYRDKYQGKVLRLSDHEHVSFSTGPKVTVGIKGMHNLKFYISDKSKLYSLSKLDLNVLILEAQQNALVDLDINSDLLDIEIDDNAKMKLTGSVEAMSFKGWGRATGAFEEMDVNKLKVNLADKATVHLNKCQTMAGKIRNESMLIFQETIAEGMIDYRDNAVSKIKEN